MRTAETQVPRFLINKDLKRSSKLKVLKQVERGGGRGQVRRGEESRDIYRIHHLTKVVYLGDAFGSATQTQTQHRR